MGIRLTKMTKILKMDILVAYSLKKVLLQSKNMCDKPFKHVPSITISHKPILSSNLSKTKNILLFCNSANPTPTNS